jgi:hypothetical protein
MVPQRPDAERILNADLVQIDPKLSATSTSGNWLIRSLYASPQVLYSCQGRIAPVD